MDLGVRGLGLGACTISICLGFGPEVSGFRIEDLGFGAKSLRFKAERSLQGESLGFE